MKAKATLLIWILILNACSPAIIVTQAPPVTNSSIPPLPSLPESTDSTSYLPESQSATEQCTVSWAYSPLKELSGMLDGKVKTLNPTAEARASAFGEDCIYSDGHIVFHAIETDFYIELPVTDLIDFESFGNWMSQSVLLVNSLSPDKLAGPHTGFVEYSFTKNEYEHLIVRIPIQTYEEKANGKTGEELFRLFYTV